MSISSWVPPADTCTCVRTVLSTHQFHTESIRTPLVVAGEATVGGKELSVWEGFYAEHSGCRLKYGAVPWKWKKKSLD